MSYGSLLDFRDLMSIGFTRLISPTNRFINNSAFCILSIADSLADFEQILFIIRTYCAEIVQS